MKKITIFFAILLQMQVALAQNATNADYDKFCGEWQWVNATDTFKLFMKKGPVSLISGKLSIEGVHKYVHNGVPYKNYWINNLTQVSNFRRSMSGFFMSDNPSYMDGGTIWDYEKNRSATPKIQYNTNGTLTFSIVGQSGIFEGGEPGPFKLPTNIILTKQ